MIDLEEIEARIRDCKTYNFGLWNADKLAHEDAPAMLDELRHLRMIASANQGAIVNSIIERTQGEPSDAQAALAKIRKAIDSEEGWVEFGHRVEAILHEYDWANELSDESVPCPECGEPRPFGLDFMCLDCNGVRYVSENDWYAHHGCGFEEEWKYQREAREAVFAHTSSCPWIEGEQRVAEALCAAENAGSASWDLVSDEQREWYTAQARVALRAAGEVADG